MNRIRFFLFVSVPIAAACLSPGIRKELRYSSDAIAFYSLAVSSEFPSWLDQNAIAIEPEPKLISLLEESLYLLGNKNGSLTKDSAVRIFSKEMSKEISSRVYESLKERKDFPYQLWILKKEDPINPGRRIRRTVFVLYPTIDSFHIVFLELDQFIDFQTPYSFQDWSNFSLSDSEPNPSLEIFIPDSAIGKSVYFRGTNSIELQKYHILIPYKESVSRNKNTDAGSERKNKNFEERLIELKRLYEKNLISEEEYRKKRTEILDSL
ncbi:SHOCT domain-containing protein [Leptospira gomenensis]|uniref:SHOCT domain-containing protein n=1 Tax=Leptospira gomenensis TaxID=2484974 RepID=A0A5F1YPW4_9LEPT|nr:SHOCT domain-containing protein [Leptospira gomenensis]TGK27965.1 SHOCT domain-containing protein [Leptospira gomenensis]TGK37180.1 SHOCT domain-containing protein [Leptospira gomenensis]TGK45816.1 SHOCT domain-containing protein [Leptospira gomenensis]TGK59755.1 SHOCT domain-containing protein [Leptospira gomenensis]